MFLFDLRSHRKIQHGKIPKEIDTQDKEGRERESMRRRYIILLETYRRIENGKSPIHPESCFNFIAIITFTVSIQIK